MTKKCLAQKIFGSKEVWSKEIKAPKKLGQKSRSKWVSNTVTAEMILILTGQDIYVAWTNEAERHRPAPPAFFDQKLN